MDGNTGWQAGRLGRFFSSWGKVANVEPHSWMHLEGKWVATQIAENRLPLELPLMIADESLIMNTLNELMSEMNQDPIPDLIILQNLFQNWARSLARFLKTRDPHRSVPPSLLLVRDHLDENFTKMTPLDDLAKIASMSRSHLSHLFCKVFGTTISRYVIRKRMSVAERLLYDLSIRPGEIEKEVGYLDIYQFSKQFKMAFGVSPTEYRKRITPDLASE
jgi:AraC-like DNA-binding protein